MAEHAVVLYALSTCIHCRHAREFLEENHINFDCTYVDKLEGDSRKDIMEKVKSANPRLSFPTLIVGPAHTIVVGFDPNAITEALRA